MKRKLINKQKNIIYAQMAISIAFIATLIISVCVTRSNSMTSETSSSEEVKIATNKNNVTSKNKTTTSSKKEKEEEKKEEILIQLEQEEEVTEEEKEESQNNIEESAGYYIKVNNQANVVTIYEKNSDGDLTPIKAMTCSTGTATPESGVYSVQNKWEWGYLFGNVWGHYTTKIVGNILFHSVPYLDADPSTLEYWEYDKLGTSASMGCVRLCVADAAWIFYNMPYGTPVEFYSSADPGPLGKPGTRTISDNVECRGWDPTDPDENNPWRNQVQEVETVVEEKVEEKVKVEAKQVETKKETEKTQSTKNTATNASKNDTKPNTNTSTTNSSVTNSSTTNTATQDNNTSSTDNGTSQNQEENNSQENNNEEQEEQENEQTENTTNTETNE